MSSSEHAARFIGSEVSEGRMSVAGVLGVLGTIEKVLGNRRVQAVLSGGKPQPPTCGQDQRLDILIEEVRELNASVDRLIELQAAALRFMVEQAGPTQTMDLIPDKQRLAQVMDAVTGAIEERQPTEFQQHVREELRDGFKLKPKKRG